MASAAVADRVSASRSPRRGSLVGPPARLGADRDEVVLGGIVRLGLTVVLALVLVLGSGGVRWAPAVPDPLGLLALLPARSMPDGGHDQRADDHGDRHELRGRDAVERP